jgi:glycosyltransferase involved in cell wall biosynthesis
VLVIDDGSTDNTSHVAKFNGAVVIRHQRNLGQGAALRSGFDYAIKNGLDIVITLDADGQHDPSYIDKFIKPIIEEKADLVIGSRFMREHREISFKTVAIRLFTLLVRLLTELQVTDVTCGYRAIRVSSLRKLKLTQNQYSAPEILIEAWKRKLRILEIPVHIYKRKFGLSKKRLMAYSFGLLFSILRTRLVL